ncbi:MAG: hypothetical protein H7Z20_02005 [Bdellovibrio sp.]|nr:hypothetical protein [Methylotenera sp.]
MKFILTQLFKGGVDAKIALVIDDLCDEVIRTLRINKLYNALVGLHNEIGIAQYMHIYSNLDQFQTIVSRNWLLNYYLKKNESPSFLFKQNRDLINLKKILSDKNVYLSYGLNRQWINQELLNNDTVTLPIELGYANQAWKVITSNDEKGKPKARIKKWLDENTELSNEAKDRISIVANWDKTGGATKT